MKVQPSQRQDDEIEMVRRKAQIAYVLMCDYCDHTATQFSDQSRIAAIELHQQGWRGLPDGSIVCKLCLGSRP